MEIELYFKKVYAVAFKLTGNENIASDMATIAITNVNKYIKLENQVTLNLFQLTIIELVKIFLKKPKACSNSMNNSIDIQLALLKIRPMSRVTVIWKDVLGFNISDNMPIENFTRQELLKELACGRKEMIEFLKSANTL